MALGTYLVKASDLNMSHHAKLDYREDDHKFVESRRIEINGIILDDQRGSRLLINGEKSLHGLPFIMTIEAGDPVGFKYPLLRKQTNLAKDKGLKEPLLHALGSIAYEKGTVDSDLSIEIPEGLYGHAIVGNILFNDMWAIARNGNALASVYVEIFGEHMIKIDSIGQIEYVWQIADDNDFYDLNISSFEYSF